MRQLERSLGTIADRGTPELQSPLEKVDYIKIVESGGKDTPQVLVITNLHPDEFGVAELVEEDRFLSNVEQIRITQPHLLAAARDQRVHVNPLTENQLQSMLVDDLDNILILPQFDSSKPQLLTQMIDKDLQQFYRLQAKIRQLLGMADKFKADAIFQTTVKKDLIKLWQKGGFSKEGKKFVIGWEYDLNRQFDIPLVVSSWETLMEAIPYDQAKLLLNLVRNYPSLKYSFSTHEDLEFGFPKNLGQRLAYTLRRSRRHGDFYMYYCAPDARNNPDFELIMQLKDQLITAVEAAGFQPFTGIDDPHDRRLGNHIERGFCYQPVITQEGKRNANGSFESAIVDLGMRTNLPEFPKIFGSFTLELAGGLSKEEKATLLDLVEKHLIKPLLTQRNIHP